MRNTLLILFSLLLINSNAQNWQLSWADEFEGTELDLTNWTYDIGTGSQFGLNGWGNNELQYYTDDVDNVSVSAGMLHITARQENFGGMNYTSGRIKTLNKQFWTYGKFEARIKLPQGQGIWPAFWMLRETGVWPGEIDIMEIVGHQPNMLHGTCHQGTVGNVFSLGGSYNNGSSLADDFHVYTVVWFEDNIQWFIDDILYFEVNRSQVNPNFEWLFEEDYFLLLNVAVGGNWPGSPDGSTSFPQEMLVDWVRVYEYLPQTVDVTFRVNMSEQTLNAGDVVYLNGSFNNWCGSCNPMINTGNGVWTTTVPLSQGLHEYKFTTNGWNGLEESFSEGMPCTITTYGFPDNFVNRFVNVGFEDQVLPAVCFDSCELCANDPTAGCTNENAVNYSPAAISDDGSCLFNVDFSVDLSTSGVAPDDVVNLNGSFNGWCGDCQPMTPIGNDVYTVTIPLAEGAHEYKFTTNGWTGLIENFAVDVPCTNTTYGANNEVYTNRIIQVSGGPLTLDLVCFNSCDACFAPMVNLTLRVDLGEYDIQNPSIEYLTEGVTNTLEMQHIGWGLYQGWVSVESGSTLEYRFTHLGMAEILPMECNVNGWRNHIATSDEILPVVCFSSCEACVGCLDPFAENYNPFALTGGSCGATSLQGCTYLDAINYNPAATADDGSCVFAEADCVEDINGDQLINTTDLLAVLASFGTSCD